MRPYVCSRNHHRQARRRRAPSDAISTARERVRIVSPYFLPDSRLMEALAVASLRGVKVEIYLPSDNNVKVVEWAAMAQIGLMMEHGCRVFITKAPFDHTKLTLVDDLWALVGSTNWVLPDKNEPVSTRSAALPFMPRRGRATR